MNASPVSNSGSSYTGWKVQGLIVLAWSTFIGLMELGSCEGLFVYFCILTAWAVRARNMPYRKSAITFLVGFSCLAAGNSVAWSIGGFLTIAGGCLIVSAMALISILRLLYASIVYVSSWYGSFKSGVARSHARFQFSVRTLMVWVLLAAITLSWPALLLQRARRQKEAVQAIRSSGGVAVYRWGEPVPPNPDGIRNTIYPSEFPPPFHDELRDWLGIDLVDDVIHVWIKRKEHSRYLDVFPQVESLGFPGEDADDTVLERIGHLKRLEVLLLFKSPVTDAGLRHLEGLRQLEVVDLRHTRVTQEGIERLQQALPKARINY